MDKQEGGTIEIRQYIALLRRWLWLIVLATLLAATSAFITSKLATPIYEATTTLLIGEGQKPAGPDYNTILMGERLAKTYAQRLKERPVLKEAAARLNLPAEGDQVAALAGVVSVEPVRDTQLIRLKVRHADPTLAAAIANAIPQVFIEQNERLRSSRFAGSKESLAAQMATLEGEIEAAQADLEAARARAPADAAEVARLETLLSQYRATYASLLQSYEQIRVAEATAMDTVIVSEPAEVPGSPVLPRTRTNTLLAAIVGGMLAVGTAFLIEYLDDTIKNPEDVERVTRLATLAHVVLFREFSPNGHGPPVTLEPDSSFAEGFRVLRTNVQFAALGGATSSFTLLVTSAEPEEGKTTILANLGASLAQVGKRVIVVDTDLRRPSLHRHFHLKNEAGLTSLLLRQEDDLGSALQPTIVEGLQVLVAGPVPANPAEVLASPQTGAVLDRLKALADFILLDSSPILSGADASILAQKADGVLLVAEAGRTRTGTLVRGIAALEQVKARFLGVVLNKVSARRGTYYYYDRVDDSRGERRRRRRPGPDGSTPHLIGGTPGGGNGGAGGRSPSDSGSAASGAGQ